MVGRKIFQRSMTRPLAVDSETMTGVEGYYDPSRRTIYLHLTGAYDTSTLISSLEVMHQQLQEKGFLMAWSSLKLGYARSLLVLFSVCHLLLLCHPTHVFDISYIHLFRTLDTIRSKAQNYLAEVLRQVPGISNNWVSFGRLCAPRVLFIFSSRLLPIQIKSQDNISGQRSGAQRTSRNSNVPGPLRNLELALEDQIYRLLRKSRVITNISANSLFALPNNQAYVYIMEESQEEVPASSLISNTLQKLCSSQEGFIGDLNQLTLGSGSKTLLIEGGSNRGGRGMGGGLASGSGWDSNSSHSTLSDTTSADALSASILAGVATERKRNLEHRFNVFLQQHIDQALGKGFDDNVGRHSGPVFFQVPRANVWFDAVNRVYTFFMAQSPEKDTKVKQILGSLQNLVETEVRFSDARCAKVLPLAVSAYKDGLPPHYTQMHHQEKLDLAQNVLSAQARGPMYEEYVTQLEEACERIWQDGRMGCETLSLTGNTCKHPRHRTPNDTNDDSSLPVMIHNSGVMYISFCNCGRRQGQREDSFSVKAANYTFYQHLAESCCIRLESIPFPTFIPSVTNAKAAKVDGSEDDEMEIDSPSTVNCNTREQLNSGTPHTPGLSLVGTGLSGSMNNATGTAAARMTGDQTHMGSQVVITLTKDDSKAITKDRGIIRQASTTEYLPGMLHTASPPGLLPRWSSWSLCCLGPSSLYSHNAGICEQPGFLPGTNFLLPWDVTVKIEDRDKWPAIADTLGKKALLLKNKKNKVGDIHEFSVKIFLGVEYECIRGHRFMMATPDRHLKASPSGLVKDNATKIANADMPLYFPCPCGRSGGQLMRLHVVTPKAPVNVTLSPQVQPGPDPCPRYIPQPCSSLPVKLSASAYWVLRLPYVYVGDQGPHYPPDPRQQTPPSFARLHKGCYGISQVTLER
ncbi:nonsense-mediated mRNA decay factor SMG8 [Procambarus clarkii]|uniref:nonsense-mediated mRNA decay factor SMG8 n=1 Tax=Procambarus clarkii TaxID=6728 RepID=UPI003743685F